MFASNASRLGSLRLQLYAGTAVNIVNIHYLEGTASEKVELSTRGKDVVRLAKDVGVAEF